MSNPYDAGSNGQAYGAVGVGEGLQGLVRGVQMAHEMKNQDMMRSLGFQRMEELSQYRGGLLDLKSQLNDIAKERADAYRDRSDKSGAKTDPIGKDMGEAIKAGSFIGPQVPVALRMARELGRVPSVEEVKAAMPKSAAPAAAAVAPAQQGFDMNHPLDSIGRMFSPADASAAQPATPPTPASAGAPLDDDAADAPAAAPAPGGYNWRSAVPKKR